MGAAGPAGTVLKEGMGQWCFWADLTEKEKAWRGIWQDAKQDSNCLQEFEGPLAALPNFLDRESWTASMVRDTLKRMTPRKAPGLDG